MANNVKIRFKPTDNIFDLPYEEAERLYQEDNKNFEFVDAEFKKKIKSEKTSTTFNKVVVGEVKAISEYTYAELKDYCKKNGLKQTGKQAELLERALAHNKLTILCEKLTQITGRTAAEGEKAEDIEKEIIEALTEKVKEAGKEIEQNPVTIEYLEGLLEDTYEIKE